MNESKKILIAGAGRSSAALIEYLLRQSEIHNWKILIGDQNEKSAAEKLKGHPNGTPFLFDVNDQEQRKKSVSEASLVISLLPPHLHLLLATDCVEAGINFITASYLSPEIAALHDRAVSKNVILLNECGLDPGIDHMSAMDIIHRLQSENGELTSFKSYTGGLVAPESNDNPWGYKFSWNPRNVILAGAGTARYIKNGSYRYIPYNRVFTEIETIKIDGLGSFDGYANRDSLAYRHHYGIENIPTLLRGTLRYQGYCRAWDVFVKLGLTDDSFKIEKSESLTYAQITDAFIPSSSRKNSSAESIAHYCGLPVDGEAMTKIIWTGILGEDKPGLPAASPAMILQHLLEQKWKLESSDRDMIVMQHQFEYLKNGIPEKLISSLVVKGENQQMTAMAKTVGWPLGIAAKLILENKVSIKGAQLPVSSEIYRPVLDELKTMGVSFTEKTESL